MQPEPLVTPTPLPEAGASGDADGEAGVFGADPSELESTAHPREGATLGGKYELRSLIGEGGMGTVWCARNLSLDVDVAVKLIRREIKDPSLLERFMREARASARLQHPAIVRAYDYGTTPRGEPYMVMELLQGKTLAQRLDAETRIDALEAVSLLLPIASGLSVAHEAGVVHRDLKPENVFLSEDADGTMRPVIMDFGIAKLRVEPGDRPLTGQYGLVGTPEYMSPEQLGADGDVDARSDVWGLCVLLHEVIAGQRPFQGASRRELFAAIVTAVPPTLEELGVGDAQLSAILQRGMAKDPEQRWASMRELGAALAQWAADAGLATDAAGVTLERWPGVSFAARRRSRPSLTPPRIEDDDRTPAAMAVRAGSVPSLALSQPPPARRFWTTAAAAALALIGLAVGGLSNRADEPVSAMPVSPAREGVMRAAAQLRTAPPALLPTVSATALPDAPAAAVAAPSRGASSAAHADVTPSPAPSARGRAAAGATPEVPPRAAPAAVPAAVPSSRVPAVPNF